MRSERFHATWLLILAILCALVSACGKTERSAPSSAAGGATAEKAPAAVPEPAAPGAATPAPPSRRIIRTAEMSVETDTPAVAVGKLTTLADAKGGFVASSETSRSKDSDGAETMSTTIVFRVPVAAFDDAVAAVRAVGSRVSSEKIAGQDVTEEYVDLEARIRAQRAVEEQYVSILKEAKTIPDVLAVQQKLGEARTEIERAEGRRRYLESQTNLSTITVHLARHIDAVDAGAPGFGRSISEAGHDAVAVGIAIVNGAIRLVGVLLPVGLLVGVPGWLLVRTWRRRRRVSAWRA
jgi:hypothetical protein